MGQGARLEVNTPIVSGGNYGWRVYEGSFCTGNDPALCIPQVHLCALRLPARQRALFDDGQVRLSRIQNALAAGTYVFGDFCTGEILAWDGNTQNIMLDTALNISSFGEDEDGELYFVGLGGASQIVPTVACTYEDHADQPERRRCRRHRQRGGNDRHGLRVDRYRESTLDQRDVWQQRQR